ncbi:hypothetical protein STSP_54080 [Streptomyces jeddahensis]|uniref:RNA polymerase sigma factor n=1 Tax=Streptomyces jeddahensis TaxID=1716141 RepID=A0A177HLZ3_9ACTN|nr:hypothetical protein STSP_54080 [Streptomyces jeddahensis]
MTRATVLSKASCGKRRQDGRLSRYQHLPAIKADLLRRLGRTDEAAAAYRQALELTGNEAERAFLTARLTDEETSPA